MIKIDDYSCGERPKKIMIYAKKSVYTHIHIYTIINENIDNIVLYLSIHHAYTTRSPKKKMPHRHTYITINKASATDTHT